MGDYKGEVLGEEDKKDLRRRATTRIDKFSGILESGGLSLDLSKDDGIYSSRRFSGDHHFD